MEVDLEKALFVKEFEALPGGWLGYCRGKDCMLKTAHTILVGGMEVFMCFRCQNAEMRRLQQQQLLVAETRPDSSGTNSVVDCASVDCASVDCASVDCESGYFAVDTVCIVGDAPKYSSRKRRRMDTIDDAKPPVYPEQGTTSFH
jgi:hypothetical protein